MCVPENSRLRVSEPMSAPIRAARNVVRLLCRWIPIRGRHRLVAGMSGALATGRELVRIGALNLEIDHSVRSARSVYYGIYEEHLVNWIYRTIRPGDVVIEPGTNVGYIASQLLDAIAPTGTLICLEPSRVCYESLVNNNRATEQNGMYILNAALSDAEGIEEFCETTRIVSAGYGFLKSASQHADDGTSYLVQTHSVDWLMMSFEIPRLRFLKLDIEGSELNALRGAAKTLRDRLIDFIMVETHADPTNSILSNRNSEIWSLLATAGFRPNRMTRAGTLIPITLPPAPNASFRRDIMWARH
jgi:FkbM family methyltransferase